MIAKPESRVDNPVVGDVSEKNLISMFNIVRLVPRLLVFHPANKAANWRGCLIFSLSGHFLGCKTTAYRHLHPRASRQALLLF